MLLLTGLACAMSERLAMGMKEPTPTRVRRLVVFPVARSTPVPNLAASAFDPGLVGASAWTTPGASAQLAGLTFDSPIATPFAFATPVPFNLPTFPTATPTPIATSTPAFDFVLAEFYNSPTSNSFLMVYVAVVDPKEIPIGDMKIVGTRLDQNLTYESPLSTWQYSGSSGPGEVVKTGNIKFEPPGGIETTSWVLHLEDAHGRRQSEDIPFDVAVNNKQWYFIKLRRLY